MPKPVMPIAIRLAVRPALTLLGSERELPEEVLPERRSAAPSADR
jgi:hypothetical protein